MSNIQSVIVYRNPMEAALWELLMSGGFFAVIVGVIAFFAVFMFFNALLARRGSSQWPTNISLILGGIAGLSTTIYMFSKI